MNKLYYTFLYLVFISTIFSACSSHDKLALKTPPPICSKTQEIEEKNLSINIDQVLMIMPEEKKKKTVIASRKKVITKKPHKIQKKPIPKAKKTVIVKPKKLIKKKKSLKKIKKNIGNKVCRNGSGLLSFMSLNLVGIVEKTQGDRIQVKIINSHSEEKPMYNGIGLYKNTLVWDKYDNWILCK